MRNTAFILTGGLLLLAVLLVSGCTSTTPQAAPATVATPVPTTIQTTVLPTTIVTTVATPVPTTVVATQAAASLSGSVILHDSGTISVPSYKTFDFKSMGYEFLKPGEKYRVAIKADKPVLGYAILNSQADVLAGSSTIPQYVSYSKKIQWGLLEPSMILEKATDASQDFTVEEIGPYTYVIDTRWMQYDNDYKTTQPFSYDITITKL